MTIWVDAQLSPAIATWIGENFGIEARAARDLLDGKRRDLLR